MKLYIDAQCNVGQVRQNNEDMILFLNQPLRDDVAEMEYNAALGQSCIATVVCDGMGGVNGGEIASEQTVGSLLQYMADEMASQHSTAQLTDGLRQWQQTIHRQLTDQGNAQAELYGMGCTLVGLFFVNGHIFFANCGDSRLYRWRDGILKQLSRDHSMREQTGDMNIAKNIITNSIGGGERTYLDITLMDDTVLTGDLYLLCSDGLSDMLTDEQIAAMLDTTSPTAGALVDAANAAGGRDNISVCLVQIEHIGDSDFVQTETTVGFPETTVEPQFTAERPQQSEHRADTGQTVATMQTGEGQAMDELTTDSQPNTFDLTVVTDGIEQRLALYGMKATSKQLSYLPQLISSVQVVYPEVTQTRRLSQLVFAIIMGNAMSRLVQSAGVLTTRRQIAHLDDNDFVLQPM